MKKTLLIIFLILSLIMTLSLSACVPDDPEPSDDSTTDTSSVEDVTDAPPVSDTDSVYKFKVDRANGYEVAIDANMNDVLAALGEPLRYNESPSCAYTGLDKEYVYAGFKITTRPDGEMDYVNAITLTDDSVTTAKGIYIGASADEVRAAYGSGDESSYKISYTDGNTSLSFSLKDGAVSAIDYLATAQ